jgi:hypothetical protein
VRFTFKEQTINRSKQQWIYTVVLFYEIKIVERRKMSPRRGAAHSEPQHLVRLEYGE